jgi:long-chain acyl-CoA synthetase
MTGLPETFPTVVHMLQNAARNCPGKEALVFEHCRLSYRDYAQAVAEMAHLLRERVQPGQRVVILMPNSADFAISLFAALAAGMQTAPLNPLYTAHELRAILADCEPSAILVSPDAWEKVAGIAQDLGLAAPVLVGGGGLVPLNGISGALDLPLPDPDGLSVLQYTGGTTGRPKGVNITHRATATNVSQRQGVVPINGDDRLLVVTPLYHVYASSMGLFAAAYAAATLVILPRFTPELAIEAMEREKITFFAGSPTIYQSILASGRCADADFSHLALCFSGASALPGETLKSWESQTGSTICEGFGQTETGPVIAANPRAGLRKIASVGIALPETAIEIVDTDTGTDVLGTGMAGEIRARGPQMMQGYRNRPAETAQTLRGGWVYTGDIGYLDSDGYLFISDRKKDMMIVSGFNVFPREVEDAIHAHPDVQEVAVFGIPHPRKGETIVAHVVASGLTEEALRSHLDARLTRYKLPEKVIMVDALPKTAIGKIDKAALRATALDAPDDGESPLP